MACRFDFEDKTIAAGCADGMLKVIDVVGPPNQRTVFAAMATPMPITCLRWRPATRAKNLLVSGCADGSISYWHITSGKMLHRIIEHDNHVFALDFRPDGEFLASAGKDFKVRVYDDNTKSLVVTFNAAAWYQTGHSNRVFSIKFVNDDPNILLTGGWDNTIRVWDIRESTSVRAIYGPTISGDSLDYSQGTILTGSYRNKDQLQLWDFGTGKVIQNIDWGGNSEQVYIYAAQFSKFVPHYIIAGCSGANQVRIFDRSQRNKAVYCVEGFNKGVYSVDFCNNSNNFSFGGGDASVYFMDLTM
eukprot:TRINITY_DN1181_c0_g2_i2.p1 TRINITY_DN1181_c0_g2~~TRINITY_DN1181_c0_g2_i2.p1  ORF type:complete len:302 (+),score=47.44 TRINITY_DN1181_c0_g2_i2:311-1216(+)